MGTGDFWKYGLAVAAGVFIGVVGVSLLSRGGVVDIKKTAASLLSHGMDLKDKAAGMMETAKENLDDLAAEARSEQDRRQNGQSA